MLMLVIDAMSKGDLIIYADDPIAIGSLLIYADDPIAIGREEKR